MEGRCSGLCWKQGMTEPVDPRFGGARGGAYWKVPALGSVNGFCSPKPEQNAPWALLWGEDNIFSVLSPARYGSRPKFCNRMSHIPEKARRVRVSHVSLNDRSSCRRPCPPQPRRTVGQCVSAPLQLCSCCGLLFRAAGCPCGGLAHFSKMDFP